MSDFGDFLGRLAARALGVAPPVRPRLLSRFEAASAWTDGGAALPEETVESAPEAGKPSPARPLAPPPLPAVERTARGEEERRPAGLEEDEPRPILPKLEPLRASAVSPPGPPPSPSPGPRRDPRLPSVPPPDAPSGEPRKHREILVDTVSSRRPPNPSQPEAEAVRQVSRKAPFAVFEPPTARPAVAVTPAVLATPTIPEIPAAPAIPATLEIPEAEILPGRRLVPRSTLLVEEPSPFRTGSPEDDSPRAETRMEARMERDAPAEPVIRVTIGRIEVRATAPAPPPAPAARPSGPRLTLEEYLRRRGEGRM